MIQLKAIFAYKFVAFHTIVQCFFTCIFFIFFLISTEHTRPNFVGFFGMYWINWTRQRVPTICSSADKFWLDLYRFAHTSFNNCGKLPNLKSLYWGWSLAGCSWLLRRCKHARICRNLSLDIILENHGKAYTTLQAQWSWNFGNYTSPIASNIPINASI